MTQALVNMIVELALEMEKTDPVDFAELPFGEEAALRLVAPTVIENAYSVDDPKQREITLLAVVSHLVVENMVLNRRLMRLMK